MSHRDDDVTNEANDLREPMKQPPDWASKRVQELTMAELNPRYGVHEAAFYAFARYIAEHVEPPVDPDLIAARKVCAELIPDQFIEFTNGTMDNSRSMTVARAAIRLGREMGNKG